MARLNALWWWIDRWRKSTAYTDMTLAEQGGYRNLLDEANLRGGALPNDERVLAKASGDAIEWPNIRAKVMARFELLSDGWHNATLDEVLSESNRRAEKQAKWRNSHGNSAGNADGNRHGNRGGSPSPSPSPSQEQTPRTDKQPTEESLKALDYWQKRTESNVRSPSVKAKYLGVIGARLREGATVEDLCAVVDWACSDKFYCEQGYTKQPLVLWRNSARVEEKATAWRARRDPAPGNPTGNEPMPWQRPLE